MKLYAVVEFKKDKSFAQGRVCLTRDEAEFWASQQKGNCTIEEIDIPVAERRYSDGP